MDFPLPKLVFFFETGDGLQRKAPNTVKTGYPNHSNCVSGNPTPKQGDLKNIFIHLYGRLNTSGGGEWCFFEGTCLYLILTPCLSYRPFSCSIQHFLLWRWILPPGLPLLSQKAAVWKEEDACLCELEAGTGLSLSLFALFAFFCWWWPSVATLLSAVLSP